MTAWATDELTTVGNAVEVDVASHRTDGTLGPYATIWAVRIGDDLYVRSAFGSENPWFQRALGSGTGRVRAGGVERDVAFETPGPEVAEAVTSGYRSKYDGYPTSDLETVVSPEAVNSTLRLVPR